jgi:hypothetical protein
LESQSCGHTSISSTLATHEPTSNIRPMSSVWSSSGAFAIS